jgi:Putative auto-transporter adhesin, head GIN domain
MTRKLLIIFASGLFFAIVLLSSAWVIGGPTMLARIEKDGGFGFNFDDDSGPKTTRNLVLGDIKTLTIAGPVTLKYTKGTTSDMVVSGSEKLMKRLRWENGKLSLDGHSFSMGGGLTVTITAPQLPDLELRGAGDVELVGVDQLRLSIDSAGAVDLTGDGKVETLLVDTKGASDVDLSELIAKDAKVSIAGAGDVDINASGKVDASIAGAGDITLHQKPEVLTSSIHGAGSIEHDY